MKLCVSTIEIRKWYISRSHREAKRSLVFFIGFYLYLWLYVDLRLIYHAAGEISNFPSFFKGWPFFMEFVSRPGGLLEYIASFLSQLFYIGWAGALVATLQAWSIGACICYFLKNISYKSLCWIRFIPSLLLLVIYTQYTYHFTTVMALLVAVVFVCLYLNMISKGPQTGWLHLIMFLVLSVILYYIAAGAYLLFAMACTIYELMFKGRWLTGLLCLLLSVLIPYIEGVLVCGVRIANAYSDLLPFSWNFTANIADRRMITIVYLVYLLIPTTALALGLWQVFVKFLARRKHKEQGRGKPAGKPIKLVTSIYAWYFEHNKVRWTIGTLVLFGIAVGVVFLSYDTERKALFEVDYYSCHKMWPQVLKAARNNLNSFAVIHAVNRALYHTGRLNTDIFSYPQYPGTLFLTVKGAERAYWKKFDLYIDLGLMNLAQTELDCCLEMFGERPLILKRLALVNMVKGDIDSARIYLGILDRTLFDAKWAEYFLSLLQSDPNLVTDSQIQHLRSQMPETDYAYSVVDMEDLLALLLKKNWHNRMAFEYLMGLYILDGRLEKFANNFQLLSDFGYTEVPGIYEEALLLHVARTQKKFNLGELGIRKASYRRLEDFNKVFSRYRGNKEAAFNELAMYFRNSYYLYYLYMLPAGKE